MKNLSVGKNGEALQQKKWYALYTKPKWERKVSDELLKQGFDIYCPMTKVYRRWSDRIKILQQPLFSMYVFINIDEKTKWEPLQIPGIIKYVTIGNKQAVIRNEEIELLKNFLLENESAEVIGVDRDFRQGDVVKVNKGLFINNTGTVVQAGNNRVEVLLESLSCIIRSVFRPVQIEKITV